jgi:hypothetical protein
MSLSTRIEDVTLISRALALMAVERAETGIVFNPMSAALCSDPYLFYERPRRLDRFHRCRNADGWVLSRYADIVAVLRDPTFSADERNHPLRAQLATHFRRAGLPSLAAAPRQSWSRMWRMRLTVVAILLAGSARAETAAAVWDLPAEGSCGSDTRLRGWPLGGDAPAFARKPGDVIEAARMDQIQAYLPPPIWDNRERFFFDGMRLEVGPCFRDYSPPAAFRDATEKFRGQARLQDDGALRDHVAGLPFPPDAIARDDSLAGMMWAWNVESRWQAAGFRGKFRTVDLVHAEPYEGEIWKREIARRADRPADGYRVPDTGTHLWAAGGRFFEPFSARGLAWLQLRDMASTSDPTRWDDLYFYMQKTRKVHDLPATGVEGIFVPSFSMASQRGEPNPGSGAEAASTPDPGSGPSAFELKRTGFEGLELRPLLYSFRVLGVEDILAPINAVSAAYPTDRSRDFGPSGLSWASDRWDLRRALVLEGAARPDATHGDPGRARMVLWVDLQTLYPLYFASYDSRGEPVDVGYWVGRFGEDVRVIEPVGAAFANPSVRGSWRRESWEVTSAPEPDGEVRRALSVGNLSKSR